MSRLAVTGAFGYSGKRITRDLLARGDRVLALTNSPGRPHPFDQAIEVAPLAFADPTSLSRSLSGCDVLVNTHWVSFNHRTFFPRPGSGRYQLRRGDRDGVAPAGSPDHLGGNQGIDAGSPLG